LAFDEETYHQKNQVETAFSVMKESSEGPKNRKHMFQVKEIKVKVILNNISQFVSTFLSTLFEKF